MTAVDEKGISYLLSAYCPRDDALFRAADQGRVADDFLNFDECVGRNAFTRLRARNLLNHTVANPALDLSQPLLRNGNADFRRAAYQITHLNMTGSLLAVQEP